MPEIIKKDDLYRNGICECKANLKGRHINFNQHSPQHYFSLYMCIRCDRPIYWPMEFRR